MKSIQELCNELSIPNPWLHFSSNLPIDDHGWFHDECKSGILDLASKTDRSVAIELGAWLGASTRFLATQFELVIAIDHWSGSLEHHDLNNPEVCQRLPTLYRQFLINCLPFANKILPIRMSTRDAARLHLPAAALIFVDAAHDEASVAEDLKFYYPKLMPGGTICGDDWNWMPGTHPVRRAVKRFASRKGLAVETDGEFWSLLPRR